MSSMTEICTFTQILGLIAIVLRTCWFIWSFLIYYRLISSIMTVLSHFFSNAISHLHGIKHVAFQHFLTVGYRRTCVKKIGKEKGSSCPSQTCKYWYLDLFLCKASVSLQYVTETVHVKLDCMIQPLSYPRVCIRYHFLAVNGVQIACPINSKELS